MTAIWLRPIKPKSVEGKVNYIKRPWAQRTMDKVRWYCHLLSETFSEFQHAPNFETSGHISLREHLKSVEQLFTNSCTEALKDQGLDKLIEKFGDVDPEFAGVFFEGTAMGLAIVDFVSPSRADRWKRLQKDFGASHAFTLHAGLGMAMAKLEIRLDQRFGTQGILDQYDPNYRAVIIDGYAFYLGYFDPARYIEKRFLPEPFSSKRSGAFDQGLGRSLWFSQRGNVRKIRAAIMRFAEHRQANLWAGVGLACAYSGGVGERRVTRLKNSADTHKKQLARGAALAALVRLQAGNMTDHTEAACQLLGGQSADELAQSVVSAISL
jgi:hypothetical protein